MGRRAMEPGDTSPVTVYWELSEAGRWARTDDPARAERVTARCRSVCVDHGQIVDVKATVAISRGAPSRSKYSPEQRAERRARQDLRGKVEEALRGAGEDDSLSGETLLVDAVDAWFAHFKTDPRKSESSARVYETMIRRHLKQQDSKGEPLPNVERSRAALDRLRLRVANDPGRLSRFLQDVANKHGAGACKTTRTVLNNVLTYSVRHGAIERNMLRELGPIHPAARRAKSRDRSRGFTIEELWAVVDVADQRRREPGIPRTVAKREAAYFLTCLMACTGARISEAKSIRWRDVDLDTGHVVIAGTKTEAADRGSYLPSWLRSKLRERKLSHGAGPNAYVVPSPASADGTDLWDESNVNGAMREVLDAVGARWAVPHTFRRTFATLAHSDGANLRVLADALGHADPSMTARVYLGRDRTGSPELAATFERPEPGKLG